jgi:hypothetical protein
MLTVDEALRVVLAPLLVAAAVAAVGRWRQWPWAMPVAVGAGFLAGYALVGVPRLPPLDGTDWLFWLALPVTALGVIDALIGWRWGWLMGAAAGPVALLILAPLRPHAISVGAMVGTSLAMAAAGAGLCYAARLVEERVGPRTLVAGLCVVMGGAAVVVFSSNLRSGGLYGLAAAAALAPVAAFVRTRTPRAFAVATVAVPILAGLLAGGHFYPEPGVTWTHLVLLIVAPALLLIGALVPGKRRWVRPVAALLAVAVVTAAIAAPAALAAKKASEPDPDDPYAAYK